MANLADRADAVARVNRAIDYVQRHLDGPLPLEDVARAAHLSPFHFHRVFRALVGETVREFVARVRLERALHAMAHHRGASLTEIALSCGFSSLSTFSRAFRARYGVSPRAFDLDAHRAEGRAALHAGLRPGARPQASGNPDAFAVTVRRLPRRRIVYARVTRAYGGGVRQAADRLVGWARAQGLAGGQWLGIQWEDPEVVPLEKVRYDVALVVPDGVAPGEGFGADALPAMEVAEVAVRGTIELELRTLHWLYGEWLPASGAVPDDQPAMEVWNGEPFAHGDERFDLWVHLPIRR